MMDKEKVIGGLAACTGEPHDCAGHTCPYFDFDDSEVDYGCRVQMELDALALLKEQDAVEPEVEVLNEIDRLYRCPKCHKHFFYRKQRFCDQCGQAVKWNEHTR